ncbi:MAG: hypothetical protein ABIN36_16935 [Ferruginibacter sp.]
MKSIYLVSITALLVSNSGCKSMKYSFSEKVMVHESSMVYELIENQMIIHPEIDGKKQPLLFDLGAMTFMAFDTSIISNYSKRESATFGSASGAGKGKISIKQIPISYNDGILTSENLVFRIAENTPFKKDPCKPSNSNTGVYGVSKIKQNKLRLLIDFDEKKIRNLSSGNYLELKSAGFEEVRSDFKWKGIVIHLIIDGKEYSFLFDTGFNGSLLMPASENYSFTNEPHLTINGMLARTLTEITTGLTNIYQEKKIRIGNTESNSSIVVTGSMNVQNVGVGFIKNFNWLIDYKEKKVFFKKNSEKPSTKLIDFRYKAALIDSNLVVSSVNAAYEDYQVGKRIVSVNGELVNDDNKCALQNLLNNKIDWKQLHVIAEDFK